METSNNKTTLHPEKMLPFILLSLGVILPVLQWVFHLSLPNFIFGWPFLLVIAGTLVGIHSKFKHPIAVVLIILGLVFSWSVQMPLPKGELWLPAIFILWGFFLVTKSKLRNNPPADTSKQAQ